MGTTSAAADSEDCIRRADVTYCKNANTPAYVVNTGDASAVAGGLIAGVVAGSLVAGLFGGFNQPVDTGITSSPD